MDKMINLKINGMDVSVPAGSTILEAARQVGGLKAMAILIFMIQLLSFCLMARLLIQWTSTLV